MTPEAKTRGILDAIGNPHIEVWFGCGRCAHSFEQHKDGPCSVQDAATKVDDSGEITERGACPCSEFLGGFPDKSPRGVLLQQLTWWQYDKISPEGLPVIIGLPAQELTEEEREAFHQWARRAVAFALCGVRAWDDQTATSYWQPAKIVNENPDNYNWEMSIDQFDKFGRYDVDMCAAELIGHANAVPPGVSVGRPKS